MSLEKVSTFDFETTAARDSEELSTRDSEAASVFDCPACEATTPSKSVSYDALGYAVCPACGHSPGPALDE